MNRSRILSYIGIALIAFSVAACSDDLLDEQPRSKFGADFFSTEKGLNAGITSLYAHMRWIYGQAYYYNACLTGTDEYTWAQSADGNFRDMDLSGVGQLTPSTSRSDAIWGVCFTNINTANAIIENGEGLGLAPALIAEARFFRAFDYFLLTQTFGGVPLDLGSGELKFNISPLRTSVRNTVAEVYTRAIFPDLLKAINDLPENPRVTGGVTKNVARLYLAKAYLTYGWWLENPNGIPTYPETQRQDPDGHDAAWYFQEAYDVALEGIKNPGPYRLMDTFYELHLGDNERNAEMMLWADHTEESEYYNGGSLSYGSGGAPDNFAVWMVTCNYTLVRSAKDPARKVDESSVHREASQAYGRPWTRMAPPVEVFTNTFADKTYDSRYDGTFVTTYRANWFKGGVTEEVLYNANGMEVRNGDAILTFLDEDDPNIVFPTQADDKSQLGYDYSNLGAGELPGRADYVVGPSNISRLRYPGLWKLGTYRKDTGEGLGQPNAGLTRPYYVAKFSEFYFIAAEAAVKGAQTEIDYTAKDLINVIRGRAGKWIWDNNGNQEKVEDYSAVMRDGTPDEITIDFILAERSREYFGEGYRWYDLVRTQKWQQYAATYSIAGPGRLDWQAQTFTRTIEKFHYLRPIPQGQIDALDMSEEEKDAYQNPGYN
jgi:hypothetical protein